MQHIIKSTEFRITLALAPIYGLALGPGLAFFLAWAAGRFREALLVVLLDFVVERGALADGNKPSLVLGAFVYGLHTISPELEQGGFYALRTRGLPLQARRKLNGVALGSCVGGGLPPEGRADTFELAW